MSPRRPEPFPSAGATDPMAAAEIAELREQLHALRLEVQASRDRMEYVTRGLPVGILEADASGQLVMANDALKEMFGLDPVVRGIESLELIHPDDQADAAQIFMRSLDEAQPQDWVMEFRILRPDGQTRWIRSIGRTHFDAAGGFRGVLSTWLDITNEVAAASSVERFVAMLNAIPDPVMIIDDERRIVYSNPAAIESMSPEVRDTGVFAPDDATWRVIIDEAMPAARRDGHWTGELAVEDPSGEAVPYLVSLSLQHDQVTGRDVVTSISREISALKRAEALLRQEAMRDPLTGLPNRRALFERLSGALARSGRSGTDLAVLFIDLDHFKPVNDEYGHETGDDVLVEVARRISDVVREGDTVARIGGDEFVVVCEPLATRNEATTVARRIIETAALPVRVGHDDGEVEVRVGASVGVAFAQPDVMAGELVRCADHAAYRAKAAGRGRLAVWDDGHGPDR